MNIGMLRLVCAAILALAHPAAADETLARIKTIVVIYAENRSFDHLYGFFPGADGKPDPRFPRMPNEPFRIDASPINIGLSQIGPSPIRAFYHQQEQINAGRNNLFAAMSTVGGYTMGHFDGSQLKL